MQEFNRTTSTGFIITDADQQSQQNNTQNTSQTTQDTKKDTQENNVTTQTPQNNPNTQNNQTTPQTNNPNTQTPQSNTPQGSIKDKVNADMQEIHTKLEQEALVKKQEALLNTKNPPPSVTTQDKQRLEKVYNDLENALSNNANFVVKTDLSLRGITELIAIMRILNDFYLFHVELQKDNKNSIENAVIDIEKMNKSFEALLNKASFYIQEALNQMDNSNTTSLELRKELEILHDLVQKDLLEIKDDVDVTKKTLEKLEQLEETFGNLEKALAESQALSDKHAKVLQEMKDFMQVELTKAVSELMLKKEEYERDLQATRDLFLTTFNELLRRLQDEASELINNAESIKTQGIDEINKIANNRLNELKKLDIELSSSALALKDEAIADIQSKLTDSLNEFENRFHTLQNTFNTLDKESKKELLALKAESLTLIQQESTKALQDLDSKKQESLTDIQEKKDNLDTEITDLRQASITQIEDKHTQAIKNMIESSLKYQESLITRGDEILQDIKDANTLTELIQKNIADTLNQYLADIQGTNFTELKNYLIESLTPLSILNKDLQVTTFTQNATWNPPKKVKNVFVNIRGGTGGHNNNNSGGFSSFGNYLSANGGSGNVNGDGQFGESKFAFLSVTEGEEIQITVASGGFCTITYY